MRSGQGIAAAALLAAAASAHGADWLQYGYDARHSANNDAETTITRENVARLAPIYSVSYAVSLRSAPVFLGGVTTASGVKDLLFMVGDGGEIIAADAADGSVVWRHDGETWSLTQSAPAVDPNRRYVYAYALDGKVHKYSVADGAETKDDTWPEVVTLKPDADHVASALAIATAASGRTYLYAVTNGYYGDGGDYQGHLVAIDLASGTQKIFNAACSDLAIHFLENGEPGVTDCAMRRNGIWGRPGAVYDAATDRVYVATANGRFDANVGGYDWGDSVLALAPDGSGQGLGLPLDSFTPDNYAYLEDSDLDYGAASLVIVRAPATSAYPHLGAQMGKEGVLHLINLDDMSGAGLPGVAGGALQSLKLTDSLFGPIPQPATWVDPARGSTWVFVSTVHALQALKLEIDGSGVPSLAQRWSVAGYGSPLVANGILFYDQHAFDPTTGTVLADVGPDCCQWGSAILVNGRMYAFDSGWDLTAYGVDAIFGDGFDPR